MKKLLTFLLLSLSAFATTTVTGHVLTLGTGNVTSGAYVRFWLRGCAGNQPRVSSSGAIAPTQGGVFYFDFPVSGSGTVSGTLYSTRDNAGTGNGDIECGGSFTAVWYGMQVFVGGKGGPEVAVHAKSGAVLDIANAFPLTTNPVTSGPAGDVIYLRLDGRNSPVTGSVSFSDSITVKNQGNFGSGSFSALDDTITMAPQSPNAVYQGAANGIPDQYAFWTDSNGTDWPTFCADQTQSCLFLLPMKFQFSGFADGQPISYNTAAGKFQPPLNVFMQDNMVTAPKFVLPGATSGQSTFVAPATGGGTVTLPQGSGTLSFSGSAINPSLIGPALAPRCLVDGVTMVNLAACINYLKGTLGLQGGVIDDFLPEDFTVNPFRQSFAAQVFFGVGYNSTTCDSTHVNCWVTEVPLVLPSNTKLRGHGRVGFGNNLSAGTPFINGNSFPAPLGIPTEGSITCAASGGFLSNGTYPVQIALANNLQTAVSSTTPIVGTSFPTTEVGVVCANGGANQSITGPSPSAAGSGSFAAQDYYVYASATTGTEVQQPILANNFSCATPGVLDTTTCKMGSSFTIKAIQTGTNPQPVVDTTNAMMVETGQQSQGSVTFGNDLRDITLQAQFQGVNSPNVMLYNTSQELSGAFGLNMNGTPGGYTVGSFGPGAGIYGSNLNLNSRYEHLQISFSTSAGTLFPVILDGRDGGGQANGMARSIHDATIVAKTPGVTPTALIWALGTNPGNAVVGLSEVHMEGINGNDCLLVDQGATALVGATMCGGSTAYTVHVSSTGGGVVTNAIASGTNRVLKDDVAGRAWNQAFMGDYVTPSLGFGNVPTVNSIVSALAIGSGSSISATSLCSTTLCPAGVYDVSAYLDITTACGTTGTYIVWLGWTDDQGAKTGSSTTTFIPLNGSGVTQATGALALSSTANYGQGHHVIKTTGAATSALGSINYGTTATACGSGGPMVGKLYLTVTRMQ